MRVRKFAVEETGKPFTRAIPTGATFLTVQIQGPLSHMWWLVRPEGPEASRQFIVVGTGHDVPDGATYLGTLQRHQGKLVLHLFEVAS